MHAQLAYAHNIRFFNVIDALKREELRIEVAFSLPFEPIIRALDQVTQFLLSSNRIASDTAK